MALLQNALVVAVAIEVGKGGIVSVVDAIALQPNVLVIVTVTTPAGTAVIVCPEIVPAVLANANGPWPAGVDKSLMIIIPLEFPHVGFVGVNDKAGFGLITTDIVPVETQPTELVAVTL